MLTPSPKAFAAPAYRADIDGLRAISVLAVVLYHLGFTWLPGGFVGVDVFFVISGYVIFRSLRSSLADGTFTLTGFFTRRFFRLHPALFVVVGGVLVYAYWVATPREYVFLAQSALYAIFGLANIFFQDNAGNYFSASAESNPLLHTWSLGVEEQFYLMGSLLCL